MTLLDLTTPTNIATEKTKFFTAESYQPQFEYIWEDGAKQALVEQFTNDTPAALPLIEAMVGQNGTRITEAAKVLFSITVSDQDNRFAEQCIKRIPPETNVSANEVAHHMRQELTRMNLQYSVEIVDQQGFQCRPDHAARSIHISAYLLLQFQTVQQIVRHEITHIIRAINGNHNNISPGANYLPTEEGLACLVQDDFFGLQLDRVFSMPLNTKRHVVQ